MLITNIAFVFCVAAGACRVYLVIERLQHILSKNCGRLVYPPFELGITTVRRFNEEVFVRIPAFVCFPRQTGTVTISHNLFDFLTSVFYTLGSHHLSPGDRRSGYIAGPKHSDCYTSYSFVDSCIYCGCVGVLILLVSDLLMAADLGSCW